MRKMTPNTGTSRRYRYVGASEELLAVQGINHARADAHVAAERKDMSVEVRAPGPAARISDDCLALGTCVVGLR